MSEKLKNNTFVEVLKVILRYRWIFVISAVVGTILILLVSLAIPLKYTAVAVFESHTDAAVEGTGPSKNETFRVHKMTLRQELASPKAVAVALEELGMKFENEDDKFALAKHFSNRIKIRWRVRADRINLVEVEFTHEDPKIAEGLPNILVRNYIKLVTGRIINRLERSREFLVKQVEKWSKEAAELKKKDIEFCTRYGMALGDGPKMLKERIEQIEVELESLRRQKNVFEEHAAYLKKLAVSAKISTLNTKLRDLRDRLDKALTIEHMTVRHPKVLALQRSINNILEQIRKIRSGESDIGADAESLASGGILFQLATTEAQVKTVSDEIARLENLLQNYRSVISRAGPVLYTYSQLQEKLDYAKHQAIVWQQKLSDIETALEGERAKQRTQLKEVQLAKSPDRPLSPRLWTVLIFALAGGFAIGYIFTFGINSLDHTIRDPEQFAKQFSLPVVGMIEQIVPESQKTLRKIKQKTIGTIIAIVLLVCLLSSFGLVVFRLKYPAKYSKIVSIVSVDRGVGNV